MASFRATNTNDNTQDTRFGSSPGKEEEGDDRLRRGSVSISPQLQGTRSVSMKRKEEAWRQQTLVQQTAAASLQGEEEKAREGEALTACALSSEDQSGPSESTEVAGVASSSTDRLSGTPPLPPSSFLPPPCPRPALRSSFVTFKDVSERRDGSVRQVVNTKKKKKKNSPTRGSGRSLADVTPDDLR